MSETNCDHRDWPESPLSLDNDVVSCRCGARWVPAEMLGDARKLLADLSCAALVNDGDGHMDEMPACPDCGSLSVHDEGCRIKAMLDRIDGVLGE